MQFELTKEFLQELREAIAHGRDAHIHEVTAELHPADIAEILDEVNLEEAKYIYKQLEHEQAADALLELDEDVREKFLQALTSKEIAEQVIENIESDEAADIIAELPDAKQEEVLSQIADTEQASDIADLMTYAEGTAGALMAKELIKVNISWTVAQCIREMRKQAKDTEDIYHIYVVDDTDQLLGRLSLRKLLFASQSTRANIESLIETDIRFAYATQEDEEVSKMMEKYDLVVLPIVNDDKRLIGRVTIDDVVDVIKEEAEEDYRIASGLAEDVESSDKAWVLSRARLPWLLIGLLGGIFGALVIGEYEAELQLYPEMAFFIPLIAAMGGNVGVQSSALIVQGLANQSLGMESIFSKLVKELFVALINGLVCSALILGYTYFTGNSTNLSWTVSIALFSVIIFAGIFGTFIPLMLNRFKIDPALATGPFITTVNDVLGLFIYFIIGHFMYQ